MEEITLTGHALQNESSFWPLYTRWHDVYNVILVLVAQ